MSMEGELPPLNPKDTTNFLLGGMQKQLEAIALEQKDARSSGEAFRSEIRESVADVKTDVAGVKSDVEVLKAKQPTRAPWYSIVAGIAGLIGGATGLVALLRILNP